ncbi:low affinity immunoglobulin gamma Fc region receptor II-a-like isoform X2 [Siniperca chuatsi]|uniref:low affinity immunoglobulin gamma Fc region receptor II-a-like isoform X2 n=1 Tax=Siniperca chuatsi TaxID=119488 RepID=UPI001CE05D80|nr:low affinity immunoglobulin gamma Fc region receptor II-a-like isoform X2 [Siniperca chuatsi]XP_044040121.1 low affinity immunoglobulin gamma Fc region receptor II-a-like isoform X2 [Siniperca chuatsi]
MEAKALCIRLLMTVLMLLVAHVQLSYPQTSVSDAAVRIVPTRLQLFEYDSVNFTCEGFNVSAGWKVRNIKEFIPKCSKCTVTTTVTYAIDYALASDSGEYWCEGGGGERSNTVSITVTAGSVILESPALPVMEGDAVTLSCRKRETSSNLTADFYKDGLLIGTSSTGHMTIHSVSKSDDGLYKCRISAAGESPGSRLSVRVEIPKYNGSVKQSEDSNAQHTDRTASDKEINFSRHYYLLLWILVTVILVLQLLVMGLLYWKKQLHLHAVLLEAKVNEPNKDMYAVVKKGKKKKDAADAADNLSLCLDTNHSPTPQTEKDKDEHLFQSFLSTFTVDGT